MTDRDGKDVIHFHISKRYVICDWLRDPRRGAKLGIAWLLAMMTATRNEEMVKSVGSSVVAK